MWFAGLGMEWRTWRTLHLKAQIDSHAAVAGLSWLFAPGWEAEFSFSEDIAVETAPDFVLQLGVRYRSSAR